MKRIMVIDDEALIRMGIRVMVSWEQYGYEFVGDASNGMDALDKIPAYRPDIILTDLKMSPIDGFELIERCREKYPNIIFIILSNYNDFENVRKAMRLGAKDYIFKLTIKPEELIKVLDEATKDLTSKPHGADDKIVVKNLESIKYGIIDNLLIDKPCPSRQPKDVFQGLSVCVNFDKPYCCMAIRIDNYKAISARGDFPKKDLLYFTMENILSELMNRYFKAETFPYKDGIFFILYNHNNEEKTIDSVFPMLRKTIQKIFGIEISGSVSPTYQNLSQIQNAVKGSLRVINENYYCTESRFYRRCHEYETEDELDFSPLATYLNRADIRGTIDYTQKLLDELARSPRKSRQALSRMMGKVYDFLLVTMQIIMAS